MEVLTQQERIRNNAKLSKKQVREIRTLAPYFRQWELAERFGISRVQVGNILARKQWADV